MKMEGTEDHNIQLAKEVLGSEPYRFKPLSVQARLPAVMQLSMQCRRARQRMGWGFDCLCWPWGRAFDWSCSPMGRDIWIFLRPTWRYLTADWETEHMFPTSTLHACAVLSGKIWKSWRPTRTSESWVDFTVLSSNFVCFSVFLINWTS